MSEYSGYQMGRRRLGGRMPVIYAIYLFGAAGAYLFAEFVFPLLGAVRLLGIPFLLVALAKLLLGPPVQEADGYGYPPGNGPEYRMIDLPEKMIFAARTRHGRGEFAVRQGPRQRDQAARQPEGQQRKSRMQFLCPQTRRGEHTGPDHAGDNHGRRGGVSKRVV